MSDCQFCESCFDEGASMERERIIKLLKRNFIANELLDLAIALIKGENK